MKKKGLKFILLFYAAGVLLACCGDSYFDYTSIKAEAYETFITSESELVLGFSFEGIHYMAGSVQKPGFFQGAYAMSCDDKGHDGPKHPITDITIISNADFNEALPAGTNLNGIFEIEYFNSDRAFNRHYINTVIVEDLRHMSYDIFLNERPDISSTHTFTFTITNTSGATYSHTTEPITWE